MDFLVEISSVVIGIVISVSSSFIVDWLKELKSKNKLKKSDAVKPDTSPSPIRNGKRSDEPSSTVTPIGDGDRTTDLS